MEWKNQHHAVGLDLGQERLKFVELRRARGGRPRLQAQGMFSFRDLGILEESERYQEIGRLAAEHRLKGRSVCLGLPQYLTTPHVTDFPAGIRGDALDQMVGYEARQLAGISDDRFIWGFQPLKPDFSWKNPVMIGLCREKDIAGQRERLAAAGLNVQDVGMAGLALANAYFFLHPEARGHRNIDLLLDIGVENSTLVIVARGQVLHVAGLMFGSDRLVKALQDAGRDGRGRADRLLREEPPDWDSPDSPGGQALARLRSELEMNLGHWRGTGVGDSFNSLPIEDLWLGGGGARLAGLAERLGRAYDCRARILDWRDEAGAVVLPQEMMIALGLALQGLDAAEYSISLIPDLLRWQQRRVRNFPCLLASVALAFLGAFLGMALYGAHLRREKVRLDGATRRLEQCNRIIPRLNGAMQEIEFYQKMLIPVVEAGQRSDVFLRTFNELARVKPPQDWCIYIADEFSHLAARKEDEAAAARKAPPGGKPTAGRDAWGMQELFQGGRPAPARACIDVLDTELLGRMIVAGFTCPTGGGRYESILKIQNALNQGGVFSGVDWLDMNTESNGREDQVFRPWRFYLNEHQRQLRTDFTMFILKLPLKRRNVLLPRGARKAAR